jgi:hypothetical protein
MPQLEEALIILKLDAVEPMKKATSQPSHLKTQ